MELFLAPQLETRVTPALLTLTQMLSLPSIELQQLVQQELSENPALEELEMEDDIDLTDEAILRVLEQRLGDLNPAGDMLSGGDGEEEIDPLLFVAAPQSLGEQLLRDLRASLPERDHAIARLVVESLDEHGFLIDEPSDLAGTLHVDETRVTSVITKLREIGPPGIATRTVQECLLAQLDLLIAEGVAVPPDAHMIVRDHLDDLGARRDRRIAQHLNISEAAIEVVRAFVQHHCYPYPAPLLSHSGQRTRYSQPDVAISLQDDSTFKVEVLHSPRRLLRLNPLYREMIHRGSELSEDEREHVQEYLARARTFLATLRQRESTLQVISEAVVTHQEGFLRHGVRHLTALTRAEIAAEVGVHESTVSRATANKVAWLPSGRLLPFSEFFAAARPVQDVLRELIEHEDDPLSDSELARMLSERGYSVARRTVAKYRDQMQILPSKLRTRRVRVE
ncbi:MAG: RNA polymerase factor sigma-54 [Chloroflexaceae bacterium]|nr:RNA polymerase factor sigma-54 [Chloroflexaceae bacterium]NJL32805.1 RNA polymerase factor sigma-54 [Chloroflexaceae bacterium]NJO05169.1 RNA polymerase factor sigma-54 [Chloroflexaceae bacterium]